MLLGRFLSRLFNWLLHWLFYWLLGHLFDLLGCVHCGNVDLEDACSWALGVVGLVDEAELEPERAAVLLEVVGAHDAGRGLVVQGEEGLAGLGRRQKLQHSGLVVAPVPVNPILLNIVWLGPLQHDLVGIGFGRSES